MKEFKTREEWFQALVDELRPYIEHILRGAKKTLELGVPICPLCDREMVVEEPEEDEEGEGE